MVYVSFILFGLSLYFGIRSWRSGSADEQHLAIALFIAFLGTALVSFFALSTLQSI